MKRGIVLLIIFALMGSAIAMMSCTWEEFDEFMGGHYGCGCFWDCTKACVESLSGEGEEYLSFDGGGACGACDNCVERVLNCTCAVLCSSTNENEQ